MREIDKIYTAMPYYGSPKITRDLKNQGIVVNHKTVERLMRTMGLCAIYPQPDTSTPNPQHPVFPYLLKKITASRPNHIWGTDITFIRGNGTWFYLTAIMDWYSRYVLAWKLSRTLTSDFCCEALTEALDTAIPDYHNSDQGSQYTSYEYIGLLKEHEGIKISMDGRGRCFDNIFTERLWRSVKYEEVYLHDYRSFDEANDSLQRYFNTYNNRRLHQSLDYKTPAQIYYEKPSIN